MTDLARANTQSASLFHVDQNPVMQRAKSTVVHRSRRVGEKQISTTTREIEKVTSDKEVEILAQSSSANPMSSTSSDAGRLLGSPAANKGIFDAGAAMRFDDTAALICEEGESDEEDEEVDFTSQSGSNQKPFGFKIPSVTDSASANLEREIDEEIQKCRSGAKSACNLSRAKLAEVPGGLFDCLSITDLSLCDNRLSNLNGDVIKSLRHLKRVTISNNKFVTVPIQLFQLESLETLLMDNNQIQSLPIETAEGAQQLSLPHLKTFGAEWNELHNFPFALLLHCPRLQELFLAENSALDQLPIAEHIQTAPDIYGRKIKVKVDNRPKLIRQVDTWPPEVKSCFDIEWNKIYPDRVLDYLYLGSLRTAQCPQVYADLDIGYILTAGRGLKVILGEGMEQLELGIDDLPGEDMKPFFREAFEFIEKARAEKRGILIHCFAGMSRSVTFTAAYLMHLKFPMTRDEAIEMIKKSRPAAQPNPGFMKGLLQWEEMLRKERSKPLSLS